VARRLGFQREIVVHEHDIRLAAFPRGVQPLTVAFASDFHAGPITHPDLLRLACDRLCEAGADLLLLGGDFISFEARHIDQLAKGLGAVPAPLGRFAVLGNHDLWADDRRIAQALDAAGIRVLVNESVRLPEPYGDVRLAGLDDPWTGEPDPERAFSGEFPVTIALMHSPSGLLWLDNRAFSLALCGHTHGGQIALPGGIPIVISRGPLCRRYSRGRFALGDGRTLITSVGVGCSDLPFRTFSPAEIVLCRLRAT